MLIFKNSFRRHVIFSILLSLNSFASASIATASSDSEFQPEDIKLLMDFNNNEASSLCVVNSGMRFAVPPIQYYPVLKIRALVDESNSSFFPEGNTVDFETFLELRYFSTAAEALAACDKILERFYLNTSRMFGYFTVNLMQRDWNGKQLWVGAIRDRTSKGEQGESLSLPYEMSAKISVSD